MPRSLPFAAAAAVLLVIGSSASSEQPVSGETHLVNIRQLTFGGENAEAYFSPDGRRLVFQTPREGVPCDQIYTINIDGTGERRVSTGTGRTTCGYFTPDGGDLVFASTHETSAACPPKPSYSRGYVWPVYDSYEIYRAKADGSFDRRLPIGIGD